MYISEGNIHRFVIAGIIGKPNTGKSTFFNAATLLNIPTGNFPFTTIEPNVGIGYIRVSCACRPLDVTDNPVNSRCIDGARLIPVKLIDVAGLVPDASQGKGLGNKFLDDVRQADALIHVVDASGSTDEEGRPTSSGSHNPVTDIDFVEQEFDLWLYQILIKDWQRIARSFEGGSGKLPEMLAEKLSGLSIGETEITKALQESDLKAGKPTQWIKEDLLRLCTTIRQTSKPTIIAANKADLPTARHNIDSLTKTGRLVKPCAAEAELLLRKAESKGLINYIPGDNSFLLSVSGKLNDSQKKALSLVNERVLKLYESTGVQEVINSVYLDLLGGVVVYPVEDEHKFSDKKGRVLPDAYVMKRGSTAKDLAYTIHSDLGNTFLHAIDARKHVRLGADYLLNDSDILKIVATAKSN